MGEGWRSTSAFRTPLLLLWVATRPSPLRIHRWKAVGGILNPESGHSSRAVDDPERSIMSLKSRRSPSMQFYRASSSLAVEWTAANSLAWADYRPSFAPDTCLWPLVLRLFQRTLFISQTSLFLPFF